MAGWLPEQNGKKYPKASHVGFGLVLGSDGKRFRTRCSEVVRLVDLLDEAKARSKAQLIKRFTGNGSCCFSFVSFVLFFIEILAMDTIMMILFRSNC